MATRSQRKPRTTDAAPAAARTTSGATGPSGEKRGDAVAVPADRGVRLPVGLPHGRADRARRRPSTGCACPGSTRPACSAACSTGRPAASVSGRSGSTSRRRARYEPGTNVLVTTWKTPTGWVVVRDALTMGPTHGRRPVTPHTRPPADDDAEHTLVRAAECLEGRSRWSWCASRCSTTAGCRRRGRSSTTPATSPRPRGARRRRCGCTPTCASASRAAGSGAVTCSRPGERVYCALSWAHGLRRARRRRRRRGRGSTPR